MAFVIDDRVRETSTTTGTGPFTTAGAPGGYQTFGSVMNVGDTTWYAIVMPGSGWETGVGTYTAANTLTRTTVISSSNGGSAVNFDVGSKDVFITQPAKKAASFPSGTLMLFQQTTAPIYWTKQTTHNDKALRVVSGTASFGGGNPFSSTFNITQGTSNTTITASQMPSHTHPYTASDGGNSLASSFPGGQSHASNTGSAGGYGSHSHIQSVAAICGPHYLFEGLKNARNNYR
jgi:hypothetical protein